MTAMLVALLCALMPAGQPSQRAAGSAFDPTTSTVALHSKFQAIRKGQQHVTRDPDKDPVGRELPRRDAAMAVAPPATLPVGPARERAFYTPASAIWSLAAAPAAFQPRAPPLI